jgi:hypothetical protein
MDMLKRRRSRRQGRRRQERRRETRQRDRERQRDDGRADAATRNQQRSAERRGDQRRRQRQQQRDRDRRERRRRDAQSQRNRRPSRRTESRAARRQRRDQERRQRDDRRRRDRERRKRERLERAVRAITPRVRKLLRKGVSKTMLRIRLTLWRLRYRLSVLELRGRQIYARVNPGEMVNLMIAEVGAEEIGNRLQDILMEAETRFYRERYRDRTSMQARAVARNAERLAAGEIVTTSLPRADRVALVRGFIGGAVPIPTLFADLPPATQAALGEFRGRRATVSRGVLASTETGGVITLPSHPRGTTLFNPRAGSYSGFQMALPDPYSSSYGDIQELVRVTEPARAFGQFAASEVTLGLREQGHITEQQVIHDLNPMRPKGSGAAADIDFRRPEREDTDATFRARRHRSITTTEIFRALSSVNPEILAVQGEKGRALNEIRSAFERWLAVQLVVGTGIAQARDPETLARINDDVKQQLLGALVAFMRMQNRS